MKVLIVDDEPLIRRSLSRVFQSKGWSVLEAAEGISGLEMWNRERPEVVLLDVLMPGLSGPQILQSISAEIKSKTKIFMMSAFTGDWNQSKAVELGAQAFLPKPFDDIFEIVRIIESASSGT